jgi:hypothetical protein
MGKFAPGMDWNPVPAQFIGISPVRALSRTLPRRGKAFVRKLKPSFEHLEFTIFIVFLSALVLNTTPCDV